MIEVDEKRLRSACNNNRRGPGEDSPFSCVARHGPDRPVLLKVCSNCPIWTSMDATYEDLFKVEIEQTYDWWREEFIRTGHSYAKDRMTGLYDDIPTIVMRPVVAITTKVPIKTPTRKVQQFSLADSFSAFVITVAFIIAIAWLISH